MPAVKSQRPNEPRAPAEIARGRKIAQIHIAKKDLAMDEGTYRAVLVRVTGERSLTALNYASLVKVVEEMTRLGFVASGTRPMARHPHVRKVYACWTAMAPLLSDPSHAALGAFVKRQVGVDSPEWLDGVEANKVIEGLKAWKKRLVLANKAGDA
jgi:phage gp16-like protein